MEMYFGWRTAVLLCAVLVTLPIIAGLCRSDINRPANRTLAMLLLVLLGVITPWMIGFAGFYTRWQWLTFLPVAMPLLVPPLAWLYGYALVHGRWPACGWWALAPGTAHFAVMLIGFCLPLKPKLAFSEAVGPWINVIVALALAVGFGIALVTLRRDFHRYTHWLSDQRSDDARYATRWLGRAIGILAFLFVGWATINLIDLVRPLGYEGMMPLYCAIAAVTVFLAIEGWRHAGLQWPIMSPDAFVEPMPPPGHDWTALGERWQEQLRRNEHFRDSELSLARAARLLATNTSYLSRACNEGLGISFSAMVNRLRAQAVAAAMPEQPGTNLLDLALAAGFASKASFNRAFAEAFGTSPSAYRRGIGL